MQLTRRFRTPALLCALAVLLCELVSRPYTNMGIADDWPYILMAQKLAATGHVVYNGWSAAMLGWQLYFAAAFIKLFGFSLTTVRMSTLLVALALVFLLQRTLVRAGISERNATIGTLAFVLSPLYLMLSVTFMSDITGLFAIVLCLYGCLRALQASTSPITIAWLCFAVATNAICGTSRQIAWLGILVMLPSTLWLLRTQRRVFVAGAAAALAGAIFIFACMQWLKQQPYVIPEHLPVNAFPVVHTLWQFIGLFLDIPFLLLPIVLLFIPEVRKGTPRFIAAVFLCYLFVAVHPRHTNIFTFLEPTAGDWVGVYGIYDSIGLKGVPPLFLNTGVRLLLTLASFSGILGLLVSLLRSRKTPSAPVSSPGVSWKQLGILLLPFTVVYILLLTPSAATLGIFDRYALGLLVVALICLVRYYQERIQPRLPFAGVLLVGIMAIYGIVVVHNTFALYRARVTIAAELHAADIPDTSIDNGWEYNFGVELQHSNYINDPRIEVPANAHVPVHPPPIGICQLDWYNELPHIHPRYAISFNSTACYGPAPFAPVHYSRWLASKPGTLYVVNYTVSPKP